ncbi:HD domain [Fragilaria crotonensis]|nr:HD domain [Fragilaria crotonensis]
MALADPYFRLPPFAFGQPLPLSRAMCDPQVYVRMRDSIIDLIEFNPDPRLRPAQDLIHRLRKRDLYKCVAARKIDLDNELDAILWAKSEEDIEQELLQVRGIYENGVGLVRNDVLVERRKIHMGAKDCNPLLLMRFLPKRDLRLLVNPFDDLPEALEASPAEYAAHLPKVYQENSIRIFCRGSETKCQLLCHVFEAWVSECEQQYTGMIHTFDEQPFAAVQIDDAEALTQEEPDPMLSPQPLSETCSILVYPLAARASRLSLRY